MPVLTSSSATWSRFAESDSPELHRGKNSFSRPSHTGFDSECSREATQLRFPWNVFISPTKKVVQDISIGHRKYLGSRESKVGSTIAHDHQIDIAHSTTCIGLQT